MLYDTLLQLDEVQTFHNAFPNAVIGCAGGLANEVERNSEGLLLFVDLPYAGVDEYIHIKITRSVFIFKNEVN